MPKTPKQQTEERSSSETPKSNSNTKWTTQWFEGATKEQKENWKLGTPQFKYCKVNFFFAKFDTDVVVRNEKNFSLKIFLMYGTNHPISTTCGLQQKISEKPA